MLCSLLRGSQKFLNRSAIVCSSSFCQLALDPSDRTRMRSFLKRLDAYQPPEDVEQQIRSVFENCASKDYALDDWLSFELNDLSFKFQFLSQIEKTLGKPVLNSDLEQLKTTKEVVEFFKIPVFPIDSYSKMARQGKDCLPGNVHVVENAVRFHPLTDTEHDGVSAFPKSSTYVTSLRYRNWLKGYRAKNEWHHFQDQHFDYTETPSDAPWLKKKAERLDKLKVDKLCYF